MTGIHLDSPVQNEVVQASKHGKLGTISKRFRNGITERSERRYARGAAYLAGENSEICKALSGNVSATNSEAHRLVADDTRRVFRKMPVSCLARHHRPPSQVAGIHFTAYIQGTYDENVHTSMLDR